jgi:hypothetical protein
MPDATRSQQPKLLDEVRKVLRMQAGSRGLPASTPLRLLTLPAISACCHTPLAKGHLPRGVLDGHCSVWLRRQGPTFVPIQYCSL